MGRFLVDYTYYTKGRCQICTKPSVNIIEYLNQDKQFVVCDEHSNPKTYEDMLALIKVNNVRE